MCTRTPWKGAVTPHRLNQNYLLALEGLLWRRGSAGARHRDGGLASAGLECPYWHEPSEFTINPITGHVDPRVGLLQEKKLIRRECNPIHQQRIGLKLY